MSHKTAWEQCLSFINSLFNYIIHIMYRFLVNIYMFFLHRFRLIHSYPFFIDFCYHYFCHVYSVGVFFSFLVSVGVWAKDCMSR